MSLGLVVADCGDGRVALSLQRSAQVLPELGGEAAFASPLTTQDLEDLRWYLEDYLIAPFAVYEERGEAIKGKLEGWGEALFGALFGEGRAGHDAYTRAREAVGGTELTLMSRSAAFLGLPWELLRDPRREAPLALELAAINRTLPAEGVSAKVVASGGVLRVLMVIARPAGLEDIGHQMIARPLLRRLEAVSGKVELEVLRPPTLETLKARLGAAVAEGRPFQVLHFDGHGAFVANRAGAHIYDGTAQGYLLFEKEGGGDDLVPAGDFALVVNQAQVPLVVLNACRSGTLGQSAAEAAVATRLLEGGAGSVVAMGYSVYAVAAAEFMASFYEALFAGGTVSQAVAEGRRQMARRKERPSPKGPLPLEDWMVPVHYLRRAISFPQLQQTRKVGAPSLNEMLDRLRQAAPAAGTATAPQSDPLVAVGRFVGRDAAFYTLELALPWQRVVVVHGPGGTGKTELAKAFGRWWRASGGVEQPGWVLFHSFEPGLASFGLDGVVSEIGLQLFGPDFIGRTSGPEERRQIVLTLLRERRLLLIWDNFESIYSLADPSRSSPSLDETERAVMRAFLQALAQDAKSGVIITSRSPEEWLGDVRRMPLSGLTAAEAAEMAAGLLAPYPTARQRMGERTFGELMGWLDGHPLSLRLMLPHLETVSPAALLEALRGNARQLPPGFEATRGRLQSLGASVKYSFDLLEAETREHVLALSLFEGVVDEDVLTLFSAADGVPARFSGVAKEAWAALLQRLSRIGLLTSLGGGMYRLHPALPAYLVGEWRERAGADYVAERLAAEGAVLAAYARFGGWLLQEIQSGSAEMAFALIDEQRRSMASLLGVALEQRRYKEAQRLLQPLDDFWDARGLRQEARGWSDRCRAALEAADGSPPDLETEGGALWLFAVVSEANRALEAGDLDAAQVTYDAIRGRLEASSGASREPRLATAYHQLGAVAQRRGDLGSAERWYRKSLEIEEALGDRPSLATSYHQLGMVAQHRGDFDAAEGWYRKSLEILEALGDRRRLATSYHQRGMVAQDRGDFDAAEGWYRKSLEILESLGNRPGLGNTYHQLGTVALRRGDLSAAEAWYRQSLEIREALGDRPGLAASYHQLGTVEQDRGDFDAAEGWYRKSLEIKEALRNQVGLPSAYHQLGMVAQHRGDLDAAEDWYRKSLEILEALGNRPGMALSYGQLGLLAEARGDHATALDWTVRSVALLPEFPHPATGPVPLHLAWLTTMLGIPALEASWRKCIGRDLPSVVRAAVLEACKSGRARE
jgi:tetratricopeptide (TPR) repeat protein